MAAILILLITFTASHFMKEYALNSLVSPQYKQLTDEMSSFYTDTVWNRYSQILDYVQSQPQIEWATYPQYLGFVKDSTNVLSSNHLIKTTIKLNGTKLIYDNAPNLQFNSSAPSTENIISQESFKDGDKELSKTILTISKPIEHTLKPTDDKGTPITVKGVLEFRFDIDAYHSNLSTFQYLLTGLIAIIILPITILIITSSRKVEDLIEKQQEASLELSNAKAISESESRAKSQFLANVSHELRTPLNAIIGFSEIINSESMGPLNNDQYKEFVKDIHTSGVHLLSLINDILDFSKAEENKLQMDSESVDLTKTIKVCLRMVMTRATEANVKLVDEVPAEHFMIMADNKRVKQIILNLLSNAVKFTPEAGSVTIKAWRNVDNNTVSMQIADTGVGMAAQDLARALSPFGQVENKLSKRFEGTGLGLPLTKKLVELMRGTFDVKSEPSLGTTVTITLPMQEGSQVSEEKPTLVAEKKD